jgi:hypothetical protein
MADDTRNITTVSTCLPGSSAFASAESLAWHTAIVDDIAPDGTIRVVVGGESGPRTAQTLLQFRTAREAADALLGQTVLVLCGPNAAPIIAGKIADTVLTAQAPLEEAEGSLPRDGTVDVRADKSSVNIVATDEIRLSCGRSSLVLRRDGTVVIRGVKIVSRATDSHRIMGATVAIN